jgi:uncharacterized membrane protein (UPF0127 family)
MIARMRLLVLLAATALIASMLPFMMAPVATNPGIISEGTVTFQGPPGLSYLEVEVADTPQEHSTGLMSREVLGSGEGMLFIFDGDSARSFWMKNTLIPLDMIFINSSMDIVSMQEDVQPCDASCSCQCPSYRSGFPAKYVVEANAGFAREHGLQPGQKVSLSLT